MHIKTLQEFREFTKNLPDQTELQVESIYEYDAPAKGSGIFEVKKFGENTNAPRIRIVPEVLLLSNGERTLEATHSISVRAK